MPRKRYTTGEMRTCPVCHEDAAKITDSQGDWKCRACRSTGQMGDDRMLVQVRCVDAAKHVIARRLAVNREAMYEGMLQGVRLGGFEPTAPTV